MSLNDSNSSHSKVEQLEQEIQHLRSMMTARSHDQTALCTPDSITGGGRREVESESYNRMLDGQVLRNTAHDPDQMDGQVPAPLPVVQVFAMPEHTPDPGYTLIRPPAQEARSLEMFLLQKEHINSLFRE